MDCLSKKDIKASVEAFLREVRINPPPKLMEALYGQRHRYNQELEKTLMKKGDKKEFGPIKPFNNRLELKMLVSNEIKKNIPEIRRQERIGRAL